MIERAFLLPNFDGIFYTVFFVGMVVRISKTGCLYDLKIASNNNASHKIEWLFCQWPNLDSKPDKEPNSRTAIWLFFNSVLF